MIKVTVFVLQGSSQDGQDTSYVVKEFDCSCGCGLSWIEHGIESYINKKSGSNIGCLWRSRMLPGEGWDD